MEKEALEEVKKRMKTEVKHMLPARHVEIMEQAWQLRLRIVMAWHQRNREELIKMLTVMERLPINRLVLAETGLGFLLAEKILWTELPE